MPTILDHIFYDGDVVRITRKGIWHGVRAIVVTYHLMEHQYEVVVGDTFLLFPCTELIHYCGD